MRTSPRTIALLLAAAPLAGCAAGAADDGAGDSPDVGLAAANRCFTTEWGPTAYNAAGAPDGYMDCGPSSLLMVGSYVKLLAPPTAKTALAQIREVRDLTRGGVTTPMSGPTYVPMMQVGATAIGMTATSIAETSGAVIDALDRGDLAIIAGDPRTAWGFTRDAAGEYLHHYGAPGPIPPPANGLDDVDHFGHWVVAFGYAPNGLIVIGDPLSTDGTFRVKPAQIDQYFQEWPAKSAALELAVVQP